MTPSRDSKTSFLQTKFDIQRWQVHLLIKGHQLPRLDTVLREWTQIPREVSFTTTVSKLPVATFYHLKVLGRKTAIWMVENVLKETLLLRCRDDSDSKWSGSKI